MSEIVIFILCAIVIGVFVLYQYVFTNSISRSYPSN